jgi:hypothetical protein
MRITEVIPKKLYALLLQDDIDAFHDCFDKWQDTTYLHDFFYTRRDELKFYNKDISSLVNDVLSESDSFFNKIADVLENDEDINWDNSIFYPLHNRQGFDLPIVSAKAYGSEKRGALCRLYAIRISDGAYIVTGGLIKTSVALQDTDEGKQILKTLRELSDFLFYNNIIDTFDLDSILEDFINIFL